MSPPLVDPQKSPLPPKEVIATTTTSQDLSLSPMDSSLTHVVAKEQTNLVTDAESVNNKDDKIAQFHDLLEYIAVSEETQKIPQCFVSQFEKDEPVDWDNWSDNHYFGNTKDKKDSEVFLVSYNYEGEFGSSKDTNEAKPWLKIRRPWLPSNEKPNLEVANVDVRRYLQRLLKKFPDQFHGCSKDDLEAMIPFLNEEHIPSAATGYESIRSFMFTAMEHNKGSPPTSEAMASCYERLYEFAKDTKEKELLVGFGHVRTVFDSSKKRTMVNGPLFEVPVILEFREGSDGSTELWISPAKQAKTSLNVDVMTVLNTLGTNGVVMDNFRKLANAATVSHLGLDNPGTYDEVLKAAVPLCSGGTFIQARSQMVHRLPKKPSDLHISDAWCLFSRKRSSTVFSKDARQMMADLTNGSLTITMPIRALLSGPSFSSKVDTVQQDELVYALPASRQQKLVGEMLFVNGEPVLTLEGPPGTGKTHSNVNIACTAVSVGKSVLMASSNNGALRAFVEKIPKTLRGIVLDMANSGGGRFQQNIEKFIADIKGFRLGAGKKELTAKLKKEVEKWQGRLTEMFEEAKAVSEAKRRIFEDTIIATSLDSVLGASPAKKGRLMAMTIVEGKTDLDIDLILSGLQEDIVLGEGCLNNNAFYEQVKHLATSQDFVPIQSLSQREYLKLVRVSGSQPEEDDEWAKVLSYLDFRKEWIPKLRALGFCGEEIRDNEKPGLIALLQAGLDLKNAIVQLDAKDRETLGSVIPADASSSARLQEEYQKIIKKIQELEAELLYQMVVASLVEKIDGDALSKLTRFAEVVGKMTSLSATSSERSVRLHQEFKALFREVAKFMPLVVMTTDQVSENLSSDHLFDLGIIDEASQSSCTAITIMARCHQMLAVGDDKQVSPSTTSEERIQLLVTKLPNIPTSKNLLPESSFFHAFKAAFPFSYIPLLEHYRCDPRIIAISNDLFYDSSLVPLRLPDQQKVAVIHEKVVASQEKGKGNLAEANFIVDWICKYIESCCENPNRECETIGVIAMVGSDQSKLIKTEIETKVNQYLIDDRGFAPSLVERHRVLVGTPQEFQGDERDIVLISAVSAVPKQDPKKKPAKPMAKKTHKKLPLDNKESTKKAWNVALSRAKNKMILVHSFFMKDLYADDVRARVLREFQNQADRKAVRSSVPWGCHPLVQKVEQAMTEALNLHGYTVEEQGGKVWPTALRIIGSNGSALVLVENGGESEEDWLVNDDQQQSLQRSGRFCLRIDCLTLVLQFEKAIVDVLFFLKEKCKMPPSNTLKRSGDKIAAGSSIGKKARSE